jgi:hypothetical protein
MDLQERLTQVSHHTLRIATRAMPVLVLGITSLSLLISPAPSYAQPSHPPQAPGQTGRASQPSPASSSTASAGPSEPNAGPSRSRSAPSSPSSAVGSSSSAIVGVMSVDATTPIAALSTSISTDAQRYWLGSSATICYNVSEPAYISIWDDMSQSWLAYQQYTPGGNCFQGTITPPSGWDYLYIYAESVQSGRTASSYSDWFYAYPCRIQYFPRCY